MSSVGIFTLGENDLALPENALISADDLRIISVKYLGFDQNVHFGEIICSKSVARSLIKIFAELFEANYEIEKIKLASEYGSDDDKIMSDNASSCFNYRTVANSNEMSLHALGRAIDINPLYNPYIQNGIVMPQNAAKYADRNADFPHKINHDDICYKIFTKHGWKWGGDWENDKDYQHFYKPKSRINKLLKEHRSK